MSVRPEASGPRLIHLSGAGRGTSRPLVEEELSIGISPEADIHFPSDREPAVAFRHGRLWRVGGGYELAAEPGRLIRVNGRPVERHELRPGDVVEVGDGGPVLRFESGAAPRPRGAARAFRNARDRARSAGSALPARTFAFMRALPRELHRALSVRSKAAVAIVVLGLVALVGVLTVRTWTLEQRLDAEALRIGQLLERSEDRMLSDEELVRLRSELEAGLTFRVDALEARGRAVQTIISRASPSVVFLQGAYGFLEPDSREPLRLVTDAQGRTVRDDRGNPRVSTRGDGPVFERLFTGTGFMVAEDGLLLTNRHVALPWESDEPARQIAARGFIPTMTRMVGYIPEREDPFEVELVVASGTADLAVMRAPSLAEEGVALPLAAGSPRPGEEVIVMGYPTGIRALLARSDPRFVDELTRQQRVDVWTLARRLSEAGHITPLATRGIVGQVTPARVVYDAETTRGGSGGPVLGLDGDVVAINMAILPEFGGSNLGVPVEEAWRLLNLIEQRGDVEPPDVRAWGEGLLHDSESSPNGDAASENGDAASEDPASPAAEDAGGTPQDAGNRPRDRR